jgi:hypothetical protein
VGWDGDASEVWTCSNVFDISHNGKKADGRGQLPGVSSRGCPIGRGKRLASKARTA